jgi:hypothetical protein
LTLLYYLSSDRVTFESYSSINHHSVVGKSVIKLTPF